MILQNLHSISGYSAEVERQAYLGELKKIPEESSGKIAAFTKKWLSSSADLIDWLNIGPIDLDKILSNARLGEKQIKIIRQRQSHLYKIWLEARMQTWYLSSLKDLIQITPDYAYDYAKDQLDIINKILKGDEENVLEVFNRKIDYDKLYKKTFLPKYVQSYDLFKPDKMVYVDEILHYKSFLEAFIKDPVIEQPTKAIDPQIISLESIFPKTLKQLERVLIRLNINEFTFIDTLSESPILSVNECTSPNNFKIQLENIFNDEYRNFLKRMNEFDFSTHEKIFLLMAHQMTDFSHEIIFEELYKKDGKETLPLLFKRFRNVAFVGKSFDHFFFKIDRGETSKFRLILTKMVKFVTVTEDALNSFVRKFENAAHNLEINNISRQVITESRNSNNSFIYIDKNLENLNDFYNALKERKLIQATTLANFRNVFLGKDVKDPIIWSGSTAQLKYIIAKLHNELKKLEDKKKKLWATVSYCFKMPGGVSFTNASIRKAKKPADTSMLDKICALL